MIDLSRNFTILFMTFYTVSFYQWVETLFYDAINLWYIASLADFFSQKNKFNNERKSSFMGAHLNNVSASARDFINNFPCVCRYFFFSQD